MSSNLKHVSSIFCFGVSRPKSFKMTSKWDQYEAFQVLTLRSFLIFCIKLLLRIKIDSNYILEKHLVFTVALKLFVSFCMKEDFKFFFIFSFLKKSIYINIIKFVFFNWDSLHPRMNSHYEAQITRKRSTKRLEHTERTYS